MSDTIGIFGGAFDPIHKGHIKSIQDINKLVNFSELKIIPCNIPALKGETVASKEERFQMLKLVFDNDDNIKIDPCELEKEGVSYTVDTLEDLSERSKPNQHFSLIMGLDAFINLTSWKNYERILELSSLIVLKRPNYVLDQEYLKQFKGNITDELDVFLNSMGKIIFFTLSQLDISSSQIKKSIRDGESFGENLDPKVINFIKDKLIYK